MILAEDLKLTQQFQQFELVSASPLSHTREELVQAFRMGNIVLANALLAGDEQKIQAYDQPVEAIGGALAIKR